MSLMKRIVLILLILFTVFSLPAATSKGSMSALEAVDYYGNTVTAEIFKPYDVTMVNIFTTWCTYCLREIPDIRQIRKDLPENANVIAICADAFEAPSDLKDIMDFFSIDYSYMDRIDYTVWIVRLHYLTDFTNFSFIHNVLLKLYILN